MNDLPEKLRETFKRKRYGGDGEYDPDFDLFDVAADEIESLRARLADALDQLGKVSAKLGAAIHASGQ